MLGAAHLSLRPARLYNQPLPPTQGSVASQPPTSHDQAGEEKTGPGFRLNYTKKAHLYSEPTIKCTFTKEIGLNLKQRQI